MDSLNCFRKVPEIFSGTRPPGGGARAKFRGAECAIHYNRGQGKSTSGSGQWRVVSGQQEPGKDELSRWPA